MLVSMKEATFDAMEDASYTVTHFPTLRYLMEELHNLDVVASAYRVQVMRVGADGIDGTGKLAGYWRLTTGWAPSMAKA